MMMISGSLWRCLTSCALMCVALTLSTAEADAQITGRPKVSSSPMVSGAATSSVAAAFKTALAKPAVRSAVRAELIRQLHARQPFALVNGYWASAIDIGQIYVAPAVRPELLAALGANGPQLIGAATAGTERITILFTPGRLGPTVIGTGVRNLMDSFAAGALKNTMTELDFGRQSDRVENILFVTTYGLGGIGTGTLVDLIRTVMTSDGNANASAKNTDLDGDGVPDDQDQDDDGDGWNDDSDHYPRDASKHICDCGRPAVSFTSGVRAELLPELLSTLNTAQARLATAVSLGPVASGQSTSIAATF